MRWNLNPYDPEAKARLDALMTVHAHLFTDDANRLHTMRVPCGWLPVLGWALKEMEDAGARVVIMRLFITDEALSADFAPGGATQDETYFLEMLRESQNYCPLCGKLRHP